MLMIPSTERSLAVQTDVTVIIRSAGERTKDLCYQLLCQQVPREVIMVLDERPFTRALQRSFEIGIELGRPWTLCVDADTLVRRNFVENLLRWIRIAEHTTFKVQGDLFDKLLGIPRKAGHAHYRTTLLPKALDFIPVDCVSQRPETFVRDQMSSFGYPSLYKKRTIGLHDFEQYHRDIYRKSFVHAHKHAYRIPQLEPRWRQWADQDPDYQVAFWGLRDGRLFDGIVPLDVRRFPQDISSELHAAGLQEKKALERQDDHWDVDSLLVKYSRMRILSEQKREDRKLPRPIEL